MLFAANRSAAYVTEIANNVSRLQDFSSRLQKLEPSQQEFAYLKAIVLFSPGMLALQYILRIYFLIGAAAFNQREVNGDDAAIS